MSLDIKAHRKKHLISTFLPFAVFAILTILNWEKLNSYTLCCDDYPLIAASRLFSISDWFFSGFSDYFQFSGATGNFSNFIRPVVNFVFWANHQLFSEKVGFYLFANILFVSLYCHQILILSSSNFVASILVPLFCIASPSIALQSIGSPPFAFDVLAAVFILGAINATLRNRFIIAIILLFFSVFTKEIGLAACAGFAIWRLVDGFYFQPRKSIKIYVQSLGFISPIIVYGLVRLAGIGIGGTYATNDLRLLTLIKKFLHFPMRFPLGFDGSYSFESARELKNQIISGQSISILAILPIILNIIALLCVAKLTIIICRHSCARSRRGSTINFVAIDRESNSLLIAVLTAASLYLLFVGAESRFYPVPQACILALFVRSINSGIIAKGAVRVACISLLTIYSYLFVLYANSTISYSPNNYNKVLSAILKEADRKQMKRVLLINAPNINSSPLYISKYYEYDGEIDFLFNSLGSQCNNLNLHNMANNKKFQYRLKFNPSNADPGNINSCQNTIIFNGHPVGAQLKKSLLSKEIIEVAGNYFYYPKFDEKDSNNESILYIDIAKRYDGIFIADYLNGSAARIKPLPDN